jgi:hypothetical protein
VRSPNTIALGVDTRARLRSSVVAGIAVAGEPKPVKADKSKNEKRSEDSPNTTLTTTARSRAVRSRTDGAHAAGAEGVVATIRAVAGVPLHRSAGQSSSSRR